MTVSRTDYLNCYSRYLSVTLLRGLLHLRIGENTLSGDRFADYGYDEYAGVWLSVLKNDVRYYGPALIDEVDIRYERLVLPDGNYMGMGQIRNNFLLFTDIMGQWRDKYDRGSYGF